MASSKSDVFNLYGISISDLASDDLFFPLCWGKSSKTKTFSGYEFLISVKNGLKFFYLMFIISWVLADLDDFGVLFFDVLF